jgi:cell division protease FtsH
MKPNRTILFLCAFAVMAAGVLCRMAVPAKSRSAGVTYSQFLQQVRTGAVDTVTIEPNNAGSTPTTFRTKNGATARTVLPSDYRDAVDAMERGSVNIDIQESSGVWRLLTNAVPFLVLLAIWSIMMFRLKRGTRIA